MIALTIWNWLGVVAFFIIVSIVTIFVLYGAGCYSKLTVTVTILSVTLLSIVLIFALNWYHTSTASGIRSYKDYKSELQNGIDREITITAEDGRQIFYYAGKVDIESNHEDNYIKFEGEDGKRYIVYYGIQDTITIIEK